MRIFNQITPLDYCLRRENRLGFPVFTLEVLRPLEKDYYARDGFTSEIFEPEEKHEILQTPVWMFRECFQYRSIAILVHAVPIVLREYRTPADEPGPNRIIDLLGAYYSGLNGESPHIELYLEDILRAAKDIDRDFKWLATIVLLHELAHAAMDIHNIIDTKKTVEAIPYSTEFGRWREESMANAVALRIIENYGDADFFDFAKSFMLSQPPEYALGVLMKDFDEEYYDGVMMGKLCGVNQTLQDEWLQYAKGTPDWAGLEKWNGWISHSETYELDGVRYWMPWDFGDAVVAKVVADYEREHGDKMTNEEFQSIFPLFKSSSWMTYIPVEEDDTPIKTIITLKDVTYSLHTPFFEKELRRFLANVPFPWTEYKNF